MHHEEHNYRAFIWHASFLSITETFAEINTVIPALILEVGGSELHIGLVSAIMIGTPLLTQLAFAGLINGRPRKKPFLLGAISVRVMMLAAIAMTVVSVRRIEPWLALLLIYVELFTFAAGGSFAGVAYVDIIGKVLSQERLKRFFPARQVIAGFGILVSALFIQIAGMIAASLVWPRLVLRVGYGIILRIWSVAGAVVPVLALAVAAVGSVQMYLALFAFAGIMTSARNVTKDAMIVYLGGQDNRVLYAGVAGTLNLSVAFAPIVLGLLIRFVGYTPVFMGVSLLAAGAMVPAIGLCTAT